MDSTCRDGVWTTGLAWRGKEMGCVQLGWMDDAGVLWQEAWVLEGYKEFHRVGSVRLRYLEWRVERQLPQDSKALGRRGCVPVKAGRFYREDGYKWWADF